MIRVIDVELYDTIRDVLKLDGAEVVRLKDAQVFDRSIDNQVSRLRRKVELDPANPRLILTVWGGGYRFAAACEAA